MTRAVDVASRELPPNTALGVRNLIINGDMRIDQRNAGASGSATDNVYTTDRWQFQIFGITNAITYQQVTDAPIGFNNSLKFTSNATTETVASNTTVSPRQRIEGYNIAHLGWGTENAKTVTISFWAKASISGVYPLAINNSAFNTSYVSEYTISSANTWEYKTITIAGPTIGTWLTDNSTGLIALFTISAGSSVSTSSVNTWQSGNYRTTPNCVQLIENSSATLQFTGVQLEVGEEATEFEHRPYDMELLRCMRYYEKSGWRQEDTPGSTSAYNGAIAGPTMGNNTNASLGMMWKVIKRARPTVTVYGSILNAQETAGILVDWNFGTTCGTATVFRVEDCGYNYISAPTATSHGHIYRIVANAEL